MSKKNIIDEEDFFGIPDMLDGKHQIIPIISADEEDLSSGISMPDIMPILTLRSSVLFPGAISPVTVGREKSMKLIREVEKNGGILGAVLQKDTEVETPSPEDMYKIGTVAKILKTLEMPNGNLTVILHGIDKIEVDEYVATEPYFKAKVHVLKDIVPESTSVFNALIESIKEVAINIVNNSANMPKEILFAIKNVDTPRGIINLICSNIDLDDSDRQQLLEAPGLLVRARLLLEILIREQQLLELRNDIQRKVKQDIDQQQRDYFLQQQMRTIQDELGGDPTDKDINEMQIKAMKKNWPDDVKEMFFKELSKIERMNPAVAEYSVQMNYLQLMLDLPWRHCTKDNLDLNRAKKRLDSDHFGLEEVKERILEHLAVLKLKGDLKAPIICLYGPPGVGKTSLGKSVAAALKRKFGRISLGGLHDEAEIRGHRKTYIGAMPGRIIQTIRRCGSSNPVIILDEIDKVSASNHGDPSSALLEVLDPEQNTTFHDNYLDIEYDLSKVLFIATANNISAISPALRDRMEMINVSGYILEDKVQIAKRHLVSKELEAQGVKSRQFKLPDNMIEKIIGEYTRESGVRTLSKRISKLVRRRAKNIGFEEKYSAEVTPEFIEDVLGVPRYKYDKYDVEDMVGVVTGLAWTEVGGDILYIESMLIPSSKGGNLSITGNLGDVMKESATIALQWVKAHAAELGIDQQKFEDNNIHVHVPEGAIPKDGPSAGITMVTSMTSSLTGRCVKDNFAMTGETTLRGRVLPVGGIKEKILAAKRAGITDLILCEENQKDVLEVKKEYLEGVTFHYVKTLDEVLKLALK
ncbi:MAG: endopeptidase La [Rikenellaceae bacterium]